MYSSRTLRSLFVGLALSANLLCFGAMSQTHGAELHLVTESYPPYNYEEGGVLKGVAVDLVRAVMRDADISYTLSMQPWARAYALALNKSDYCVFSTVHNKERDHLFEWVEPLFTTQTYLVKKQGSPVNPKTLEEAKAYLVGTQLGDHTVEILKEEGFPRVDLTSTIELSLNKLLAGRVDLIPIANQMIIELRLKGVPIAPTVLLSSSVDSLACNRHTDPAVVERMRSSLKKLVTDGTRDRIYSVYGFSDAPITP